MTQAEQAHFLVEADIVYGFPDGRQPTATDAAAVQDLLNSAVDGLYKVDGLSDVGVVLNRADRSLSVSVLVTADDTLTFPEVAMAYAVSKLREALNAASIATPGWPTKSLEGLSVRVRWAKVTEEPKVPAFA